MNKPVACERCVQVSQGLEAENTKIKVKKKKKKVAILVNPNIKRMLSVCQKSIWACYKCYFTLIPYLWLEDADLICFTGEKKMRHKEMK